MHVCDGKVNQALHLHSNFGDLKPFSRSPKEGGGGGGERHTVFCPHFNAERLNFFFFFFFALFLFCFMTASGSKEKICLSTDALSTSELLITIVKEIGRHCWGWGEEKLIVNYTTTVSQPARLPSACTVWCVTVKYSLDEAVDSVPLLFVASFPVGTPLTLRAQCFPVA